ncbi:MAG: transcriptional repressor LexA [Planctomycetota bacterium]|nr:MAG: transcriptional repressor LexA [Planctomycetota bacterium]
MSLNLTPKQLRILQLIRQSRLERGYSPTMQELADALGVSKVTVFEHVEALLRKGALTRQPHKARSLAIAPGVKLPDEEAPLRFPLVGSIAAGRPIEKCEQRDEIDVNSLFEAKSGGLFALRVEGESMRDEGIMEGDFIIVERRDTARDGDRVVALLPDGETTLKTFYREADHIRLQPANPQFEPIRVKECRVQGVVRGVVRRY